MPVNYVAEDAHGNESSFDENHLLSELKAAGHDAQNTTPDGRSLIMGVPDAKGNTVQYNVPIDKALESLGYHIKSATPANSEKAINSNWGAMLQSLPDDDSVRQHFLADKLAKQGLPNDNIIGSGNDWHFYDPQTHKWHQITEEPRIDNATGAKSAALALPHIVGSTLGGIGGGLGGLAAGMGIGAVPGAIAGTALGGAAGEALRQGGLSLADEDYRHAVEGNLGASALNVAKTGGIDAAAHGIMRGAGALVPNSVKALPGQVVGKGMAYLGKGIKNTAKGIADAKLGTDVVAGFNPLTQTASLATDAAQIPAGAAKFAVEGAKATGNSPAARSVIGPQMGDALAEGAEKLGVKRAPSGWSEKIMAKSEEAAQRMAGQPKTPEQIVPNARDYLGNAVARRRAGAVVDATPGLEKSMAEEAAAGERLAGQYGIQGEEARAIGAGQGRDYREGLLRKELGADEGKKYAGNWGDALGGTIHGLGQVGKGGAAVINGATRAGLRTIQGAGAGIEGLGVGIHGASTLGGPLGVQTGVGQALRIGDTALEKKLRDYYRRLTTKP